MAAALEEAERRARAEDVQLVRHAVEMFIVHDPEAARLAIPPIPPPRRSARAPARRRHRARVGARLVPRGPAGQRPPPPLAHRLSGARRPAPRRRAAPGPPGRAVLLHAPADARPLRRRAARSRLRSRRAVRRLSRADRRGLRGSPERPGPARRRSRRQGPLHIDDLEAQRDRLLAAVAAGDGRERRRPAPADLGAARRARGADRRHALARRLAPRLRPRHHRVRDGARRRRRAGDIGDTATAIRDPFFWRWHRHIDDQNFTLQEQAEPFASTTPPT